MNPFWIVAAAVFVLDLVGVPWAFAKSAPENEELFQYAKYVTRSQITVAYWWTLYAALALVIMAGAFGVIGALRKYQLRPLELPSDKASRRWWWTLVAIGWLAVLVMFFQAGFTVPWLSLRGAAFSDYGDAAILRSGFEARISQALFNVNLLFVATSTIVLSFFCLRSSRFWYRAASIALFVASASFSLAKSQLAAALFILMTFIAVTRRVTLRTAVAAALAFVAVILPFYMLLAYTTTVTGAIDLLAARVIYGQWAGLPYYFAIFEHDRQPLFALLPPYVQRAIGVVGGDSPGRKVMIFMEPEAALTGVAGNVPTFYVGEAFAVGGVAGALVAPVVVALELGLIVMCFLSLPKKPVTVIVFSWFLYKFTTGLMNGFSTFLISSFTIALGLLIVYVLAREGARTTRTA